MIEQLIQDDYAYISGGTELFYKMLIATSFWADWVKKKKSTYTFLNKLQYLTDKIYYEVI